jgi:hypothetical protein
VAALADLPARTTRSDLVARVAAWEPLERTGDPYADLRLELQAARRLRIPFDTAWPVARSRVAVLLPPGTYRSQRGEFLNATGGTKDEWRRAYARTGRRLRAVEAIRDGLVDEREPHGIVPPAVDD